MSEYFIIRDGEQTGPLEEGTIRQQLAAGEIGLYDLCWKEGMDDWKPLHETVPLEGMVKPPAAPPPPPPKPTPKSVRYGTRIGGNVRTALWGTLIAVMSLEMLLGLFLEIIAPGSQAEREIHYFLGAYLIVMIIGVVLWSFLHYACWKAVAVEHRVTTPGKAVGFLFIPFYNFYWAFITWPSLIDGLVRSGYGISRSARSLAVSYAVLFVCGWTLSFFPAFATIIYLVKLIVFILLYRQILKAIHMR